WRCLPPKNGFPVVFRHLLGVILSGHQCDNPVNGTGCRYLREPAKAGVSPDTDITGGCTAGCTIREGSTVTFDNG
ncbi:hypothetical protein ACI258_004898, partial [Salmonella enterica subsp. enterica serovar Montevideo]